MERLSNLSPFKQLQNYKLFRLLIGKHGRIYLTDKWIYVEMEKLNLQQFIWHLVWKINLESGVNLCIVLYAMYVYLLFMIYSFIFYYSLFFSCRGVGKMRTWKLMEHGDIMNYFILPQPNLSARIMKNIWTNNCDGKLPNT